MELESAWREPLGYHSRPVAVIGGGFLGRRVGRDVILTRKCLRLMARASCWAAAGYTVQVYDPDEKQRRDAVEYYEINQATYKKHLPYRSSGLVTALADLEQTVLRAWLLIECAPESLELKRDVFAKIADFAATDSIISSNSSSYKSSLISEKLDNQTRSRVLNTHYFMPPHVRIVELMTSGSTSPEIFSFLESRMRGAGLSVYIAKKESTGFIHNRVWAAIKRELLHVVSEGVTDPKTADDIFFEAVVKPGLRPFVAMDLVGLDTVACIERTFASERDLVTTHTIDYLEKEYIRKGKLGIKSAKGGFFPPQPAPCHITRSPAFPAMLLLDNGLSGEVDNLQKGQVLEYTSAGVLTRTLFREQHLPDGVAVSKEAGRIFWTCMGTPGMTNGMVYSADLDGSNCKPLFKQGTINTPKQIAMDTLRQRLYFCDREGLCVWRCKFDGSELEQIVTAGDTTSSTHRKDSTKWCVGVTVSQRLQKFFWTQKGWSKSWQGRIFSANIDIPFGETASTRTDKFCLLEGLPEPVDLEFYEPSRMLYWTDRGEMPHGNTLNRLRLDDSGMPLSLDSTLLLRHQILARKLHEAIGLKIDSKRRHIYVTDLGGTVYRFNLDGDERTKVISDENRAFTGITLL